MSLSEEDRQRIKEDEKLRFKVREGEKTKRNLIGLLVLLVLLLLWATYTVLSNQNI